ncbi:MAG TPA: hypothetical protein VEI97_14510 [bacterium]|nr:hypothetical protein [bacterium]
MSNFRDDSQRWLERREFVEAEARQEAEWLARERDRWLSLASADPDAADYWRGQASALEWDAAHHGIELRPPLPVPAVEPVRERARSPFIRRTRLPPMPGEDEELTWPLRMDGAAGRASTAAVRPREGAADMSSTAITLAPSAGDLVPMADLERMAEAVVKSGFFATKTKEQAVTLMLLCQAEGLHPVQAMKRYHIIQGRPSMRADAMLAEFQRQGGKVEWLERSDAKVSARFSHEAGGSVTVTWDLQQAHRAQLTTDMWKKYPRQMLTARVVSEGVRTVLPGVVAGIYTPEEVEDFIPPQRTGRAVSDLTPATETPAVVVDVPTPAQAEFDKPRVPPHVGRLGALARQHCWTREQGREFLGSLGFARLDDVPAEREIEIADVIRRGYHAWADARYLEQHPPTEEEQDWLTIAREAGWADAAALRRIRAWTGNPDGLALVLEGSPETSEPKPAA